VETVAVYGGEEGNNSGMNPRKRKTFNKGHWQINRERHHLAQAYPPDGVSDAVSIGLVVPEIMKKLGLKGQQVLESLVEAWPDIAGADVAKHTRPGGLQGNTLVVYVDSSMWLSELARYGKEKMLSNIQEHIGRDSVSSVSFRLDPGK
jgi:predicted nucleic acid-binding Zn ribbon protein